MIRLGARTRKGGKGSGCPAGPELDYNLNWNGRSRVCLHYSSKEPCLSRGNEG